MRVMRCMCNSVRFAVRLGARGESAWCDVYGWRVSLRLCLIDLLSENTPTSPDLAEAAHDEAATPRASDASVCTLLSDSSLIRDPIPLAAAPVDGWAVRSIQSRIQSAARCR